MKAIIYAGPNYGREHEVLSREGRNVTVKHATAQPFTINQCDAEFARTKADCRCCGMTVECVSETAGPICDECRPR